MGGLGKHMKMTGTTSLIAVLAIAGVPFFSGFFSKDAILAHVFTSQQAGGAYLLYALLLLTAAMTAFYMFRWYHCVFAGEERLSQSAKAHLHESPRVMTMPLVVLALFSIIAGYFGLPEFLTTNAFAHWLEPSIETALEFTHLSLGLEWLLVLLSVAAAALGLGFGYWVYELQKGRPAEGWRETALAKFSRSGAGFDAFYRALFVMPSEGAAEGLSVLDKDVLDKGIGAGAGSFALLASIFRSLQTGSARGYALVMFLGLTVLGLIVAFSRGLS
jgi:NADH-quinone oxidoreductase subunit L